MSGQDEFFSVLTSILKSSAAKTVGARLSLLAESAFIPTTDLCDANLVAAMLNYTQRGAEAFLKRAKAPAYRNGGARSLFTIADVVKGFTEASTEGGSR